MRLKYESEILFDLMKRDGDDAPSDVLPYESELIEKYLEQVEGAYPKLQDYRSEWLNYNLLAHIPAEFPFETLSNVTEATVDNVVPYAYRSAILKGSTKYRDIDTGEVLDAFEDGRNLELVTVRMPVLTTSNGDGTKTNILTVNGPVELRGIGNVRDTLDCLTGELTQRIGEIVFNGSENWVIENPLSNDEYIYFKLNDPNTIKSNVPTTMVVNVLTDKLKISSYVKETSTKSNSYFQAWTSHFIGISRTELSTQDAVGFKEWLSNNNISIQYPLSEKSIKTVDLTVTDQDGNTNPVIRPIEGTMHLMTEGETIKPLFSGEIPVEAITQNLASFIKE